MRLHFPALGDTARRAAIFAGAVLAAACTTTPPATPAAPGSTAAWTGTWGAAPAGPPTPDNTQRFSNQTLRLVVHTSIGGHRVRIRLSNEMGATPLRIGAAHLAARGSGADIQPGTDHPLTFGGQAGITVPPGAPVLSDPVNLDVAAQSDLAISLYLPGEVAATTIHGVGSQTNYISPPGNFAGSTALPVQRTIRAVPFLTEVDVDSGGATIVALGDSITDGTRSTPDTNNRWPDWLARRLQEIRAPEAGHGIPMGVVNRGISGNRLISNPPDGSLAGQSTLERFDRDVLAVAGVRYMTVMAGINDIRVSPADSPVHPADLIARYRQLIARAHASGIVVFGATLTPFEGSDSYSPAREAVREAVNQWIRSAGEFDGVIDFDAATRDPAHPRQILPAYDSGDHLHPNDVGYQAMGTVVPLTLFRQQAQQAR